MENSNTSLPPPHVLLFRHSSFSFSYSLFFRFLVMNDYSIKVYAQLKDYFFDAVYYLFQTTPLHTLTSSSSSSCVRTKKYYWKEEETNFRKRSCDFSCRLVHVKEQPSHPKWILKAHQDYLYCPFFFFDMSAESDVYHKAGYPEELWDTNDPCLFDYLCLLYLIDFHFHLDVEKKDFQSLAHLKSLYQYYDSGQSMCRFEDFFSQFLVNHIRLFLYANPLLLQDEAYRNQVFLFFAQQNILFDKRPTCPFLLTLEPPAGSNQMDVFYYTLHLDRSCLGKWVSILPVSFEKAAPLETYTIRSLLFQQLFHDLLSQVFDVQHKCGFCSSSQSHEYCQMMVKHAQSIPFEVRKRNLCSHDQELFESKTAGWKQWVQVCQKQKQKQKQESDTSGTSFLNKVEETVFQTWIKEIQTSFNPFSEKKELLKLRLLVKYPQPTVYAARKKRKAD